ncbi:MAG: hypothetical protein ACLSH8_17460 [Zhenhengia sp.]|uniref:hypothetical protein n=1 Tax=Zhenhengia sp. TaxID=2944208 RepID=UPI00399512E2
MYIVELVESVKRKLGISSEDTKQDQLIEEEINDLIIEVLEYCNLKELPRALEPFVKRKVVSYIKSGATGVVGEWDEEVKSISRGDTTINMLTTKERLTVEDVQILDKFKDKRVRVM